MPAPLRRIPVDDDHSPVGGLVHAHDMSRVELDRSYDPRLSMPAAALAREIWRDASDAMRQHTPFLADVAYGADQAMRLDVHPTAVPNAPVLILFHGSVWQMVGKDDFSFVTTSFTDAGVCVVSVEHSHCSTSSLGMLLTQARQAVLWVERHIGYYGGDPARLFAAGHGFGGTLAAAMLDTDWRKLGRGRNVIKGACAVSGLYDLTPLLDSSLNAALGLSDAECQRYSPLQCIPERGPVLILAVGGDETAAMRHQQQAFADARTRRGLPVQIVDLPQQTQIDTLQALARPRAPVNRAVLSLIKSFLT
jgi:arylformamidase